jgi:hypothetical protein
MMTSSISANKTVTLTALSLFLLANTVSGLELNEYWRYTCENGSGASPAAIGDTVLHSCGRSLVALDSGGAPRWTHTYGGDVLAIGAAERVIAGLNASVSILDYSGSEERRVMLNHPAERIILLGGRLGQFAAAGGKGITGVDFEGRILWRYELPWTITSGPVLSADGSRRLFVGSGGTLYSMAIPPDDVEAYDAEGTLAEGIASSGSGVVFATTGGKVIRMEPGGKPDTEWTLDAGARIISGPYVLNESGSETFAFAAGGTILEVNATGEETGRYTVHTSEAGFAVLSLNDSDYLLVPYGNELTAYRDLESVWSLRFDDRIADLDVAYGNGTSPRVLVKTSDGTLHALWTRKGTLSALADRYMSRALQSYLEGDGFGAVSYARLAAEAYTEVDDGDGAGKAEELILRVEGDESYAVADVYFQFGYYNESAGFAQNASSTYGRIGDSEGEEKAEALLEKSRLSLQAGGLMDNAKRDYALRDLESSEDYAIEALSIFGRLNSTGGVTE